MPLRRTESTEQLYLDPDLLTVLSGLLLSSFQFLESSRAVCLIVECLVGEWGR